MRPLLALSVFAAVTTCSGCDATYQKAFTQEALRLVYVDEHGPMVLASIIGASAPAGGPAGLHALCTDQAWRMLVGSQIPHLEHVPSMFEVPDPNRPVRLATTGRVRNIAFRPE